MIDPLPNEGHLKLLAQRALLGAISKSALGICIDIQDERLILTAFVEGQASEEEKEALQDALSEIYGDLYPQVNFDELRMVEQASSPLSSNGIWVFLRMGIDVKNN
ncbi:MAG: hypothetical protein LCI00_31440 [Chloroflexi bacterium]|nr:hypothetical protein [Chloroflexota bacterium]MCC6893253.1 hypothetical protein [Anaerolineae bacterium]